MKKIAAALFASAVVLSACGGTPEPAPMPADPLTQQLVGKTLTNQNTKIQLQEFNRMIGRSGPAGDVIIDGFWEVREGRFCRTLTLPEQIAGTECQDVTIEGETATFQTSSGPVSYILADS